MKSELDTTLDAVITKIDAGTITCEDLNKFIGQVLHETAPEGVRDRVRRRTKRTPTTSHIEPETGHQQLQLPKMADRIQPKIKPEHQQNHGRSRIAHKHSTHSQRRLHEAIQFITTHHGKVLTEAVLAKISDKGFLKVVIAKMMARPGLDRDWLYDLQSKITCHPN